MGACRRRRAFPSRRVRARVVAVRLGLRVRIVVLLGALLGLTFAPLYFAISTYAQLSLQRAREDSARSLGRVIGAYVSVARVERSPVALDSLLEAQVGGSGVSAIGVYGPDGLQQAARGERELLPARVVAATEELTRLQGEHGAALAVRIPDAHGAVVTVLRVDDEVSQTAPLTRLVAGYMGLLALALLLAAYFALTRLIVRPLDALRLAAQRVEGGARRLEVPRASTRELDELGVSLQAMTERLLTQEQALRGKVTEIERATAELHQAQAELIRSERLASVGRLSAGLAHEVGNPLSALIGLQDLLLLGGLSPEEERDFLQRMRLETERIQGIVRDLLQFARPERSAPESLPVPPGDVTAALHETLSLLKPQRSFQDMQIELAVEPALPRVALGTSQLVQVILNLALNAADACGGRGRLRLEARLVAGQVELVVEDDGPGVAPEVRARLFEPFVTTKEVGAGTGLGLAVCRGLVEGVTGTLGLEPGEAGGARFVVRLPVSEAHS